jgi:rubrerythrin
LHVVFSVTAPGTRTDLPKETRLVPHTKPTLTRGQVLARGVVATGALAAGGILAGGLPKLAVSQPSKKHDARVLEWLLQVEYLQAAFYTEVERRGALKGELREFAALVGKQERAHVDALERELKGKSGKRPEFDFADATANPDEFIPTAVKLEEMAVSAYNGQVPNLTRPRVMTAMKIVSVEARHAGWARDLAGRNPAPQPADTPATQQQTKAAMEATGFME